MILKKDLAVIDLETTGTWIEKDKIIEIAIVKCKPDGSQLIYDKRINPGIRIPKAVTELTGITDSDVKDAQFFKEVAAEIKEFISNCDLGGFNIEKFDLPLLRRELDEAGINFSWENKNIFDAQKIYHLNERRDLTAAYKFYCKKTLENAHSALADTQATLEIIKAQITMYTDSENIEGLSSFNYEKENNFFDNERKFRWWDGKLYFTFGIHRNKSLKQVAEKERKYLEWIIASDFSKEVKELAANALQGKYPSTN